MAHSPLFLAGREAERVGNIAAALANYQAIPPRDPSYLAALHRLGGLAARQGDIAVATVYYEQALALDSRSPEALECLATFAREGGQPLRGTELYERGLRGEPENPRLWFGLAECHLALWRLPEAVAEFRKVVKLAPNLPVARERLGLALMRCCEAEAAEKELRAAVKLDSKLWAAWALLGEEPSGELTPEESTALGDAFAFFGQIELAEKAFGKAKNELKLAKLLRFAGQYAEAETILQELGDEPDILTLRIRGRKLEPDDEPLLERAEQLPSTRPLEFALGKGWDDLKQYSKALDHFRKGNALAAQEVNQDKEIVRKTNDTMLEIFTEEVFAKLKGAGSPSNQPIFIVGMIRSGTTLTEQILSCHSMVGSAGELPFLAQNAKEILPEVVKNKGKLKPFAERYLAALRFHGGAKPRITDKLPANLTLVGFIHALFPSAKVILCERQARDVCFSAYTTPHDRPHPFLHTTDDLAFYYKESRRLAEHWKSVIPADRLTMLSYEALVTNPEATISGLLDFLELPKEEACFAHHDNTRLVSTPSEWQVRQPLYTSSLERWRNYSTWVAEFDQGLENT